MAAENLWLNRFALELLAYATSPKVPVPLLDGSKASLKPLGLAFQGVPRRKGSAGPWFRRTGTFLAHQAAGAPLSDHDREFFLVVQWRRLLGKGLLRHAQADGVPLELRNLAHHAWWCLLPLVRQHDVVMATLLERARKNYRAQPSRHAHEPGWVGFDNEEEELRFDAQAVALLNSHRTREHDREGFCELAADVFAEAMKPVVQATVQRHLALCGVAQHRRGMVCPTCPEIANERPFLLALNVPLLSEAKMRQQMKSPADRPPSDPSLRVANLRWLLEARRIEDGVRPFIHSTGAPARFIDFTRLRRVWQELGVPSVFDDLPQPGTVEGGVEANRFFDRMMGGTLAPSTYSAMQLFVESGWGSADNYDDQGNFAAVLDSALATQIYLADQRAGALVKARTIRRNPVVTRPPRREVIKMYAEGDKPPVPIGIVRASSLGKRTYNFYTTPYEVHDPIKSHKVRRSGRGIFSGGRFYWTLQTLNYFANQVDDAGVPVYAGAREFCEWANAVDATIPDRRAFTAALYDTRLNDRIDAVTRGEMAHLGAFSQSEDNRITQFFVEQPKKKRLTDEQWAALLKDLPGRTKRGVLERLEALGKIYAFKHGYLAFMKSPYHRKFSAARRKQWIKEGCAP